MANSPEILIAHLPLFTRRRLLLFLSALLAGGILPLPLVAESVSSKRNSGEPFLDDFMRLSTALTGHAGLDKELGQIYLDALLPTYRKMRMISLGCSPGLRREKYTPTYVRGRYLSQERSCLLGTPGIIPP